jgi:putative Holliday junction resolvase
MGYNKPMNLLGLDYGEKHIGAALATTFVSQALEVIPTHQALQRIGDLIKEHHIDAIILGISENQMGEKIRNFAQQLSETFHLPIHFQDETLSSQDTRRQMAKQGVKRSVRQAKTDHYVAAAILQDYLDVHPDYS